MRDSEAVKYIEPDDLGHKTRSSDSSFYDEICLLCGATDSRFQRERLLQKPCLKGRKPMTEFFIMTNSFAAPFVSDSGHCYVEAD